VVDKEGRPARISGRLQPRRREELIVLVSRVPESGNPCRVYRRAIRQRRAEEHYEHQEEDYGDPALHAAYHTPGGHPPQPSHTSCLTLIRLCGT